MQKIRELFLLVAVGITILIFSPCATVRGSDTRELRDQTLVALGKINESWRLEWLNKPKETCSPKKEESETCPCAGFAYAEYGQADLIRTREGKEIDRFHLTPLFENGELPIDEVTAVVQRWPIEEDDFSGKSPNSEAIRKRLPVKILEIADYNHDGWPSEFVLQVARMRVKSFPSSESFAAAKKLR